MTPTLNRRGAIFVISGTVLGVLTGAPSRADTTAAIQQALFVRLGRIDQWISIRGDDRSNPVLLVVHGGPGEAQWPAIAHYRAWEQRFTVVQ